MNTQLHDVFQQASQLAGKAREAYLDAACAVNPDLRLEVERLLANTGRTESFSGDFEGDTIVTGSPVETYHEREGDRIGPYVLRQRIGEGGFGIVWKAEQKEPISRMVAIKLLKAGMDTKQVLARFEAERQALAMMDHLNIARVLDAGATASGRPYFAMELVKGMQITDFCRDQKLDTRARLDLFRDVCSAVNHAHQKGIIHRDLKPSNVMITMHGDKPVPKVIDFGIAKATQNKLTDKTLFTRFDQFLGTPAYMSPEQAAMSGLDIDTRSDIYSLGVLLYEMLAGRPPFDPKTLLSLGYDEMRRVIREEEPKKPSTFLTNTQSESGSRHQEVSPSSLRGDLDLIVMKAIEKDRSRRYDTATALSDDILRHLNDEPVKAAPPGAAYRIRKFVRRNRSAVAAASVISILLVTGITVTSWWAVVARRLKNNETRVKIELIHQLGATEKAQQVAEEQTLESRHNLAKVFEEKAEIAVRRARQEGDYSEPELRKAWLYAFSALNVGSGTGKDLLTAKALLLAPELRTTNNRELWRSPFAEGEFNNVAYSPGGKSIATAAGNVIQLWITESGEEIGRLEGHSGDVRSVTFSPDGDRLLSGATDSTVRLWEISSLQEIGRLNGHRQAVNCVAFRPSSNSACSSSDDGTVRLWDLVSLHETAQFIGHGTASVRSVAFSRDGERLLSGADDGTARLWVVSTQEEIARLTGHGGAVRSAAFSPDGTKALSGSFDQTVRLWDLTSQQEIALFSPDAGPVWSVAFSPGGNQALSSSGKGNLRLWDLTSQQEVGRLVGHTARVSGAVFAPVDGNRVVSAAEDGTLLLWDTVTKKAIARFSGHSRRVLSVAFSPDGNRAISASEDTTLRVWDTATGIEVGQLSGHEGAINCVAINPDGSRAATASNDNTARLWDLRTLSEIESARFEQSDEHVVSVAFTPDSDRLLCGGRKGTLVLWNIVKPEDRVQFTGHVADVWSVAVSPDGSKALSGSDDGTLRLWNIATQEEISQFIGQSDSSIASGKRGAIRGVAFSPDEEHVLSCSYDSTVRLWNIATKAETWRFSSDNAAVLSTAFNRDGTQVLSGSNDGILHLWDIATRKEIARFSGNGSRVRSVAFHPDGKHVMSGSDDRTVRLWSIGSQHWGVPHLGHEKPINSVAFSPNNTQILSGSDDGTVRLWAIDESKEIFRFSGHEGAVTDVAFNPAGTQALSSSLDGTLRLWDIASRHEVALFSGHEAGIWGVAFSPDGTRAVSGSDDHSVRLWDIAAKKAIAVLPGHAGAVRCVAFSPDGNRVLSGSDDQTLRIWDIETQRQREDAMFTGHDDSIRSVAYSPDGAFVLSGSWDGTVRLWDIKSKRQIAKFAEIDHHSSVWSVAFSPDGSQVLSGSSDNVLRLWDIVSQQEIARYSGHHSAVTSVAFSSNGSLILSGSVDSSLRVWTVRTGLKPPLGEPDSETFQQLYEASLNLYPYRLDGFRLVDQPFKVLLAPVATYQFPERRTDQLYDKLRYQRPEGRDLANWILECSSEWK